MHIIIFLCFCGLYACGLYFCHQKKIHNIFPIISGIFLIIQIFSLYNYTFIGPTEYSNFFTYACSYFIFFIWSILSFLVIYVPVFIKHFGLEKFFNASFWIALTVGLALLFNSNSASKESETNFVNNTTYYVEPKKKIIELEKDSPKNTIDRTDLNNDNDDEYECDYILNTNTKKFHYPWCSSVNNMKTYNTEEYNGTRDDVIDMGYSPCGRCHP